MDKLFQQVFSVNTALGADVKLTIYPGVGHGGWDKTYGDPALYAWFLQSKWGGFRQD